MFSLESSKALLQFHDIVEYFISDFTTTCLAIIESYLQSGNSQPSLHDSASVATEAKIALVLSETEHSRLARAFYHMELYGDLFYEREAFHDSISPEGQPTLFLQRLRDWELEELLCVRSYLLERLTDYLT